MMNGCEHIIPQAYVIIAKSCMQVIHMCEAMDDGVVVDEL